MFLIDCKLPRRHQAILVANQLARVLHFPDLSGFLFLSYVRLCIHQLFLEHLDLSIAIFANSVESICKILSVCPHLEVVEVNKSVGLYLSDAPHVLCQTLHGFDHVTVEQIFLASGNL